MSCNYNARVCFLLNMGLTCHSVYSLFDHAAAVCCPVGPILSDEHSEMSAITLMSTTFSLSLLTLVTIPWEWIHMLIFLTVTVYFFFQSVTYSPGGLRCQPWTAETPIHFLPRPFCIILSLVSTHPVSVCGFISADHRMCDFTIVKESDSC